MFKVKRKNLQPIRRRNIRTTGGLMALCLDLIEKYFVNIQVILI